jgi:NADH-quinone oxidoreductase subunit J
MSAVLFFIAGIGAIAGAAGVVVLRDPFYSVLSLVCHLLSLAVLFLLLRSEFVAAVQVVVYAGAVMVLYVFVVAYVGSGEEDARILQLGGERGRTGSGASLRLGGALVGGALLVELLIALLGTGLEAVDGKGAPYVPGPRTYGTPAYIGNLLLTRFLLVFEVASFLLLIVAVGAVVLARRRAGLEELPGGERELLTPMDLLRPRDSGTMVEGVGGISYEVLQQREREREQEQREEESTSEIGPEQAAASARQPQEAQRG